MVAKCKEVFAFGAAVWSILVAATPVDYFPINSQLPPVARISEAFEFTFSPLTFFSKSDITYRLGKAPKWLSIDSSSRRLFGTPSDEDVPPGEVVGIPIELIAEDETGSATANPTLVVSRNRPPVVEVPISNQLPKLGTYIAPSTLHLHPSKPFSFSFDEHTFRTDSGDGGLNYYAVSGDNAPLPSWITFDAGKLSFSGKTPPFESLVQPPQTFTFQLVASDVVGFASVSVSFSIAVGSHELTAEPPVVKLNATHKKPFEYKDLKNVLKLDKKPLKPEDTVTITAFDLPTWLSFDNKTWELAGTPKTAAESSNITIAVTDKYSDTLNLTISIHFGLFISDLPDLNLKAGVDFSFDLKKYLSKPEDIRVTIEDEFGASWADFNSSSLLLSGSVPKHITEKARATPHIVFSATSKNTNETETKTMNIYLTASPTAAPEPSAEPEEPNTDDSNKNLLWLLIIPIFLIFAGIVLLLFYVRRRRQQPRRIDVREVSGPVPGSFTGHHPSESRKVPVVRIIDIAPPRDSESTAAQKHRVSMSGSNRRSQTASSPSLTGSMIPHAMMAMYSRAKSPEHSVILEASSSLSAGRDNASSPQTVGGTDEASLLSDTSIGEADAYIAEAQSYIIATRPRNDAFQSLSVPINTESFSIQNTPEIAYTANPRYDTDSNSAVPPAVGYVVRPKSGQQQDPGFDLRSVGKRISNLWKRESGGQPTTITTATTTNNNQQRNSILSDATGQTTRTSILTSGISGVGEEEATTSTNVVARPTIIHIPSRPGEVRQMSRRVNGSSSLFGRRSTILSSGNVGLRSQSPETILHQTPELPPTLDDCINPRDSDSSWDRLARNSLGIAFKDLLAEPEKAISREESPADIPPEGNWMTYDLNHNLLSPGQWPQQNVSINMVGIVRTSPANIPSEIPRLPPPRTAAAFVTSKGEEEKSNRFSIRRGPSQASQTTVRNTPSTSSRSDVTYSSRDEHSHFSHTRRQAAPSESVGPTSSSSQTPSIENGWAPPPTRPLPRTPTQMSTTIRTMTGPGRVPLASRPNQLFYAAAVAAGGGGAGTSGVENMSSATATTRWKSTRSMKSAKSLRSVWADEDDDDDDDAWEDIRPPTTIDGWDDGVDSDGSFAVHI
ncbi:uncharacterized protein F4812DRAFT_391344 [Daldinia caldariorum]|uniref:uncharacterized protein n=1 Tax=Daldinia caldariorum TaxID=326644 RepID=UPI002008030F|nr:uncharacterized protein F4812DRAFT_391344 [Daldinia caldariorum]KAI1468116.1 hypothetical protein F4812DRAFT_391344 [Daldinia caldariorum]